MRFGSTPPTKAAFVLVAVLILCMFIDGNDAARRNGKKKKALVKSKPQADAPMPTRADDQQYEEYDQTYYDEKDDYDTNGSGANSNASVPAPNGSGANVEEDEETTEVLLQPDDEVPIGAKNHSNQFVISNKSGFEYF